MRYAAAAFDVTSLSRLFAALGDDVRLRIVALLAHGELCVCHIEAALGLKQANASRHLAILRAAEIVRAERRDRWVHYSLAPQSDPNRRRQLRTLVAAFAKQELLRKDVARLRASQGATSCR